MSDRVVRPAEEPGPSDFRDAATIRELKRAIIWLGVAAMFVALWFLSQPLLLIVGGLVFSAMLDGGARLLGRVLPIGRGWRLAIVGLCALGFLVWTFYFAGSQIMAQAEALRVVVTAQVQQFLGWAHAIGFMPPGSGGEIGRQIMGSLGQVTAAVGTAIGAVSSLAMIIVIGLFIAAEPRLYERGIAWMLPMERRADFYETAERMGYTLRRLMAGRLLGMAVEGVLVAIALELVGVPMALLLGILTGLLAFLPNIGAIVSGVLIVLVGFSAGVETGIGAVVVYLLVQTFDGYVVVPMVARRSVDLPPALVLGAQLLFGALFGILGLALADPIVAMIKVLLEQQSENAAEDAAG
ncbi:MAG TPA: AI-2E family transporter [Sphingomonadaceae bacterium]|jgi:predicted PurR-regulated permease PerM|nr:AI-2E family transporter [Sphingomonadaceae bacterium]